MFNDHKNLHISNDELLRIRSKSIKYSDFINNNSESFDNSEEGVIICQSKIKNPNFFSIIYANSSFQNIFNISGNDILGKSYDFLFEDFNLDYSSDDQVEYFRLIKDIKDFHSCSIIISIPTFFKSKEKRKFKIDFEPIEFIDDLKRRHAKFTFYPILEINEDIANHVESDRNSKINPANVNKVGQKNDNILKSVERALYNERLLRQISSFIISDLSINEVAKRVAKSICQHFRVDRCIIHDYRDSSTNFVAEYCEKDINAMFDSNDSAKIESLTKYINFQNYFYKKYLPKNSKSSVSTVRDIKNDSNFEPIRKICDDFYLVSQVAVTTVFNGNVNGGIYIHQSQQRNWLADEVEVIEMIADQLSIAFDRAVSVEKVMISNHALMKKTIELRQSLKKEQEMRKMQNEFVALVSHEFKTPLQIIDGTRELLYRKIRSLDINDEVIEKSLYRIKSGIQRMNGLIGSTLNLAKMESGDGNIKIEKGNFNIKEFIHNIISKNANLAQNRNIKLLINIKDLPREFSGDVKLLEHSFNNVISNAIKYSKNNSLIKILAKSNQKKIAIRVIDSGIGIPEDDLKNIGTKFFRAKNTLLIAGTGIGLYLSKYFIKLHGGELKIKSKVNIGTSMTIYLPR